MSLRLSGYTARGDFVRTVSLTSSDGSTASILTLGARILDLRLPSGRGLLLPFPSLSAVESDGAYVGVAVGRTANRIRGGRLDLARTFSDLQRNAGEHHIHGGRHAWDKRLFSVRASGPDWVELFLFSPEGDQGYPSAVEVTVRYEMRAKGELSVKLETRNVGGEETITNMTSHLYVDLGGKEGRVAGAALRWYLSAPKFGRYLVLDAGGVPSGEVRDVKGTEFDFREARVIGAELDNYFLLSAHPPPDEGQMQLLASVEGDGARVECWSDQPGCQVYTSNCFSGEAPCMFAKNGSIAIEPSAYIDAGNHKMFPSIALLPGQTRVQRISYIFTEL